MRPCNILHIFHPKFWTGRIDGPLIVDWPNIQQFPKGPFVAKIGARSSHISMSQILEHGGGRLLDLLRTDYRLWIVEHTVWVSPISWSIVGGLFHKSNWAQIPGLWGLETYPRAIWEDRKVSAGLAPSSGPLGPPRIPSLARLTSNILAEETNTEIMKGKYKEENWADYQFEWISYTNKAKLWTFVLALDS